MKSNKYILICKEKPKNLSIIDYGRFVILSSLLDKRNIINLEKNNIMEFLDISNKKTLFNFYSKLKKYNIIYKINNSQLVVNPLYIKQCFLKEINEKYGDEKIIIKS